MTNCKHDETGDVERQPAGKIKERFPDKAPGYPGVTTAKHTSKSCRFPLWGHHEKFEMKTSLFCDAPRIEGESWCEFHKDIITGAGTRSERDAPGVLERAV